ncbi:hypothetical protein DPMN_035188 [Dreissena polymorpha]|uniref:Uncharacterized protein n=1 Tax=Dreissena polymorpha TaxID=45954 RepID=A0A9D4M890_DREPO|nr:hypothetical protein DPMN_035188 [Dreissena polymorpha]
MGSPIRAMFHSNTDVLKVIADQLRSRLDNIRQRAINTIPALDITSKRGRQICNAPLGFIHLSKLLFGTATQEDKQRVTDKVNRMIAYSCSQESYLIAHEKQFKSYMSLSSRKMANMEMYKT